MLAPHFPTIGLERETGGRRLGKLPDGNVSG